MAQSQSPPGSGRPSNDAHIVFRTVACLWTKPLSSCRPELRSGLLPVEETLSTAHTYRPTTSRPWAAASRYAPARKCSSFRAATSYGLARPVPFIVPAHCASNDTPLGGDWCRPSTHRANADASTLPACAGEAATRVERRKDPGRGTRISVGFRGRPTGARSFPRFQSIRRVSGWAARLQVLLAVSPTCHVASPCRRFWCGIDIRCTVCIRPSDHSSLGPKSTVRSYNFRPCCTPTLRFRWNLASSSGSLKTGHPWPVLS